MILGSLTPFFQFSPGVPRENEKTSNFAIKFERGFFKNFRKFIEKWGGVGEKLIKLTFFDFFSIFIQFFRFFNDFY